MIILILYVGLKEECSKELIFLKCDHKIDLQFLNLDKLSNRKDLLNVTTIVLRFINNLKKRLNREEKLNIGM